MTDHEEVDTPGDELLAETRKAKRDADLLVEKYRKIRNEVNRQKADNHIFAKMMQTLGG